MDDVGILKNHIHTGATNDVVHLISVDGGTVDIRHLRVHGNYMTMTPGGMIRLVNNDHVSVYNVSVVGNAIAYNVSSSANGINDVTINGMIVIANMTHDSNANMGMDMRMLTHPNNNSITITLCEFRNNMIHSYMDGNGNGNYASYVSHITGSGMTIDVSAITSMIVTDTRWVNNTIQCSADYSYNDRGSGGHRGSAAAASAAVAALMVMVPSLHDTFNGIVDVCTILDSSQCQCRFTQCGCSVVCT